MAARSAVPSLYGILGSNPAGSRGCLSCCECCVSSGRGGLCDGLITRPEDSYQERWVQGVIGEPVTGSHDTELGRITTGKKYIYIYREREREIVYVCVN